MKNEKNYSMFWIYFTLFSLTILGWIGLGILGNVEFFGDKIINNEIEFGWFHLTVNFTMIIILGVTTFYLIFDLIAFDQTAYETVNNMLKEKELFNFKINFFKNITMKKSIIILLSILFIFMLSKVGISLFKDMKKMYNTHIVYQNNFKIQTQNRDLFYSKMWLTYVNKNNIADLNKDVFIQITKLIMENRSDGKNLLWKWNQENQQIPFDNFTDFYRDLSNYITSQREQYYSIETGCQKISNMNNVMLDTFPNNIYNRVLKLKPIIYEINKNHGNQ